jgi:predicted nucleotidyltransferase
MKYGLKDKQMGEMEEIFQSFPEIGTVWLFGSRAKGTYKPASDVDLALRGTISSKTLMRIRNAFDDSYLPFFVDVLDYDAISDGGLKNQIDAHGVLIYQRQNDDKNGLMGKTCVSEDVLLNELSIENLGKVG